MSERGEQLANVLLVSKKLHALYVQTFGTEAGRTVLEDLRTRFHADVSTHVPGDSHESAFREGERHSAVVYIGRMLEAPDERGAMEKIRQELAYETDPLDRP